MWSDAARSASMQARGASGGQGVAQSGPLQAGLAQAGAQSRGRWAQNSKGTHSHTTITGDGAAHQTGVNGLQRGMKPKGKPLPTLPPAYYSGVASNSYAYGDAGMPGL